MKLSIARSVDKRVRLVALLIVTALTFVAQSAPAAETPSVRIVYNALGGSMAPLWIGQELGLFAKHGLQHSLNYLAATTSVQGIVAGRSRQIRTPGHAHSEESSELFGLFDFEA